MPCQHLCQFAFRRCAFVLQQSGSRMTCGLQHVFELHWRFPGLAYLNVISTTRWMCNSRNLRCSFVDLCLLLCYFTHLSPFFAAYTHDHFMRITNNCMELPQVVDKAGIAVLFWVHAFYISVAGEAAYVQLQRRIELFPPCLFYS